MNLLTYSCLAEHASDAAAGRWQKLQYPDVNGNSLYSGYNLGNGILAQYGLPDHYKWVWIGIGYLIACIVLFNVILIWAHAALGNPSSGPPTKTEEELQVREDALRGDEAGLADKLGLASAGEKNGEVGHGDQLVPDTELATPALVAHLCFLRQSFLSTADRDMHLAVRLGWPGEAPGPSRMTLLRPRAMQASTPVKS